MMTMTVMWWSLKAEDPSSMEGGRIRAPLPNKQPGESPAGMVKEQKEQSSL